MSSSIKVLSPQLATQISAGEVVEQPASVVKELVENSLDSGAMRISIDIEAGGTKMIRIRDNGCGIRKNELALALTRHATSKISSFSDLEGITSMGFRGEALASISSVSRLILTSRTVDQKEAWQAYAEGRDMIVNLKPAAHPVGTTVEVLDLFFNTPARRKFMRTVKTEFFHIDEVIRSIALSRFDVTFILQHNGKIVRKYFAVISSSQNIRRLSSLCSPAFVERALEVSCKDEDLFIHGWLANPSAYSGVYLSNKKYIYINKRLTFDRFINNAIRQAYNEILVTQNPTFVLFLDLDPYQVDINVHPSKTKIRFLHGRKVYDFIYQAVCNILQKHSIKKNIKIYKEDKKSKLKIFTNNSVIKRTNNLSNIVNNDYIPLLQQQEYNKKNYEYRINNIFLNHKVENKYCLLRERSCLYNEIIGKLSSSSSMEKDLIAEAISKNKKNCTECRSELFDSTSLDSTFKNNLQRLSRLLTLYPPHYALIESAYGDISLLSLLVAERLLKEQQLIPQDGKSLYSHNILIPPRITIDAEQSESLKNNKKLLHFMGIVLESYQDQAIIRAVPLPLIDQNLNKLIPEMLVYIKNNLYLTYQQIAVWLTSKIKFPFKVWSCSQAVKLLLEIEMLYPQCFTAPTTNFLVNINLKDAIKILTNE